MSEIESPSAVYLAARHEWSERYGSYIARERWWRLTAVAALVTSAALGASNVWLASQAKVVPYVVEVNKLGDAMPVRRLGPAPLVDPGRIKAQLARWIVDVRSVWTDPAAEMVIATEAYGWTNRSSDAVAQLDTWFQANNPNVRAGKETVGVIIDSVGPIGSENTWFVDFSEERRTKDGFAPAVSHWRATIRIKLDPPLEEAAILANPSGIYVTWFSITPRSGR